MTPQDKRSVMQIPTVTLNDDTLFPQVGLGTYGLNGDEGIEAVVAAIASGYRLLDTAVNYENEREIGEAVRRSGVDRDELFVATKIPGRHHGYDLAIESTNGSLNVLGLDRIDLSLNVPKRWNGILKRNDLQGQDEFIARVGTAAKAAGVPSVGAIVTPGPLLTPARHSCGLHRANRENHCSRRYKQEEASCPSTESCTKVVISVVLRNGRGLSCSFHSCFCCSERGVTCSSSARGVSTISSPVSSPGVGALRMALTSPICTRPPRALQ